MNPFKAFAPMAAPISAIMLAACATAPDMPGTTCHADCTVEIGLPADTSQRPNAPDVTRIAGGEMVDFVVPGRDASARTVLAFEQAAFIDRQGNPLYVVELQAGSNRFESRRYGDNVCRPPQGCRYVVINAGTPVRPAIINTPIIIIDPR